MARCDNRVWARQRREARKNKPSTPKNRVERVWPSADPTNAEIIQLAHDLGISRRQAAKIYRKRRQK